MQAVGDIQRKVVSPRRGGNANQPRGRIRREVIREIGSQRDAWGQDPLVTLQV